MMTVDAIARMVHETNRAFCRAIAEPAPPPWALADDEMHASMRAAVAHALANPQLTPEENHERWRLRRLEAGWRVGPVVDRHLQQHPNLVPYAFLSAAQQAKDRLALAVVRALAPLVD